MCDSTRELRKPISAISASDPPISVGNAPSGGNRPALMFLSPKGERSMGGFRADMLHAFAGGIEPSHHAVVDITAPIA
jgi:hypothetical protein